MKEDFSMNKESRIVGDFSIRLSVWADRVFRVLLAMVLCFQQVAWAMDDPSRDSNSEPRLSTRGSVLGLEGSLEESLLPLGENSEGDEVDVSVSVPVPKPRGSFTRGPSRSPIELPTISKEGPSQTDNPSTSRDRLSFTIQQDGLLDEEAALRRLLQIENSSWRGSLRWTNADNLLQRFGYFLALRSDEVTQTDNQKRRFSAPVWLSGGSFPVKSERTRKYILFVDGLRQGTEFVISRTLQTGIAALTLYQFYNYLDQKPPLLCQGPASSKSIGSMIDFLTNADEKVLLGVFHDVLGYQSGVLPYLRYLLATPFVWGITKGLWNTRKSSLKSEEISGILQEIGDLKPSFGRDTLRWLLPLHPLDRRLNFLMKNFLWNPDVSAEDLQKIWKCLETLSTDHHGYTPINALARVMSIAYGLNIRDVKAFSKKTHRVRRGEDVEENQYDFLDTMDDRIKIKDQAFFFLQEMANFNRTKQKETFSKKFQAGMTALYAKYLLWSLGSPRTLTETLGPTVFKAGKLYIQAKLAQVIIEAFLQAEECPKQPGVSIAGVEPWASDLTQECFEATAKIFNVIPGQPTDTLIGNLDQYYFPNCKIDLDLSGRGLSGQTIANITRALLEHNVTFTSLDLSGNAVNTPEDFEAFFSVLGEVTYLDLSNNGIGSANSDGTVALGERLSILTQLNFLNLSRNNIGDTDSLGMIALGGGLSHLTQLTDLDLSHNSIESKDSKGMVAFGEALSHLTQLTSLTLSYNQIGYKGSDGTVALGQGLSYLTQLMRLDLSTNQIGYMGSDGTVALGQGASYLTQLTDLDLSNNFIGFIDSKGMVALGAGLSHLMPLRSFNLSYNFIGHTDSNGTIALGQGLSNLTQLTSLDFSYNDISSGIEILAMSLRNLHQLKTFQFLPNLITNTDIVGINEALNLTLAPPLPSIITSSADADTYCQSLPSSVQNCDLSRRMPNPSASTIKTLMQCLKSKSLVFLSLSGNQIGNTDSEGTVALGEGLSYLTQLTSLDLSYNFIGYTDSEGTVALGEGLSYLTHLTSLNLSRNLIGYTDSKGTVALGQGLSHLTQLTSLDLSDNSIGSNNSEGTIALGEGLSYLTQLTSLNLWANYIGNTDSEGTIALGEGLSHLTQLTSLNLLDNYIGYTDSEGTAALGKGLSHLIQLTSLDLSQNLIGATNSNGTVSLGEGLSHLTQLTSLDLSYNYIGYIDSEGTLALTKGIRGTYNLRTLNLGVNYIGSTGTEGPEALISVLLNKTLLPNLRIESLNIQDMVNVSWTNFANTLQQTRSQAMMDACQISKCFGGSIHVSPNLNQESPVSSFLSQTPYLAGNATYLELPSTLTDPAESRALVVYEEAAAASIESDTLSALGVSALSGAAFAALPEALGDALHLSGMVSERNAYHVKMATNAALVFATGSWLPVGVSWLTSAGLKYMGCSESKARVGGNAVGFLVNTGRALTPTGIAAVAVNYTAGRLGLWAEKSMMKRFFSGSKTKELSPSI